jgi:preprotein translocase subunit SecD
MMAARGPCRKAGLFGLFVCLALVAGSPPGRAESLLDELRRLEKEAPPPTQKKKRLMAPVRIQVEKAEAAFGVGTKEPVVVITMSPRSARLFHELTLNNIGRVLVLRIDGQVAAEPIIREAIAKGVVQISGNFTMKDAAELAARLSKGEAKVEVELVDG